MANFDWSRFTVRIDINAPADKIYDSWATGAGMEHWFLRSCEYRHPGGSVKSSTERVVQGDQYTWKWHGYPDPVAENGSILEANGKDRFRFSFGKAGDCTVIIKMEQGKTIVELIQENIPVDDHSKQLYHVGCKTGWTFHLADMKSIFEGGVDLRNKDEQLTNMLNS